MALDNLLTVAWIPHALIRTVHGQVLHYNVILFHYSKLPVVPLGKLQDTVNSSILVI